MQKPCSINVRTVTGSNINTINIDHSQSLMMFLNFKFLHPAKVESFRPRQVNRTHT